jgi:hypothetical protein
MTPPWLPICVALSATSAVCYVMMGRVTRASRRRVAGGDGSAAESGSFVDGSWGDVGFSGADSSGSCDAGDGGGGGDCGGGD